MALSDSRAVVSLDGGSNSFISSTANGRLVLSVQGDDLLAHLPHVDFIKIDIEGFEPFALEGLSKTLLFHKPCILCEFNPRCLKDHASINPVEFANMLFKITRVVEVIEHNDRRETVKTGGQLIDLWEKRNQEAVDSKLLPDGMLHFDLLFRVC